MSRDKPRLGRLISQREDWQKFPIRLTRTELDIGDWQVMEKWEKPVMRKMAQIVACPDYDILEVGFGMGISASFIQELGCKSHTIIEAHPRVFEQAITWRKNYAKNKIHLICGFWEEIAKSLPKFDSILFDPFPLVTADDLKKHTKHYEFIAPFFILAKKLLKKNGKFTYWSHEHKRYCAAHLGLLKQHFSHIKFHNINVKPPKTTTYWQHTSIIVPEITNSNPASR